MMIVRRWMAGLCLPILAGSGLSAAAALEGVESAYDVPGVTATKVPRLDGVHVASVDEHWGVPTFVWGVPGHPRAEMPHARTPEDAALGYVKRFASLYGLSDAALGMVKVSRVMDIGRGGIVVRLDQEMEGIPLIRNGLKVLLDRDFNLVALSGFLRPQATPDTWKTEKGGDVGEKQALAAALSDLSGLTITEAELKADGRDVLFDHFTLVPGPLAAQVGLHFTSPARARSVYYPLPDRLVRAWSIEVSIATEGRLVSDAYAYVIAASDGRILARRDLTESSAFNYTVFADAGGDHRPMSGPHADYAPHPAGYPDDSWPDFVSPSVITMEGFNTNPSGGVDPWLADGATTTQGNNADAYADIYLPDGYSAGDIRAETTSSQTFDHVYDTAAEPLSSTTQSMATATNAFYVVNWLHDWYYDSGFDEAAGNGQQNNYGRGGVGGDRILVEVQDSANVGIRNNAFMTTPADGSSPRMAMFLWSGLDDKGLEIPDQSEPLETGYADFGPDEYDITGTMAIADDGEDPNSDACSPILNDIEGRIALIDRGICNFQDKALEAEAAGAIGVIIINNVPDEGVINMAESDPAKEVTIPSASVSYEDGLTLKALSEDADADVRLYRFPGVERDGGIDGMVVCHEWGHYLHHRLQECTLTQCSAMSEGWGDWVALHMQFREGDAFDGTYSDTQYVSAAFGDSYFGIRRLPYSTDFTKNAFTFRHIQDGEALPDLEYTYYFSMDNSEVHNAGEIWASMMWEAYISLMSRADGPDADLSYSEVRRRMGDYVVTAMTLAPSNPTFTEQRDALIAAALANDSLDATLIAEGFATRGAGSCADSPPRDSDDLIGVVESYVVGPRQTIVSVELEDSILSCDEDGVLDAAETGEILIEIENGSWVPMTNSILTLSTVLSGVSFPEGTSFTVPELGAFESTTLAIPIAMDESMSSISYLDLDVNLTNADACNPELDETHYFRINYDDVPEATTVETAESSTIVWDEDVAEGSEGVWTRLQTSSDNHVFHGDNPGETTDVRFVSPTLEVDTSGSLYITFEHRYSFEASPIEEGGDDVYWDGGVIEISDDDGQTWTDVDLLTDPGYDGPINAAGDNPLGGRLAYAGTNPSWPDMDTVRLDFGRNFSGKSTRIRFRIGADSSIGDYGWEIDNITIEGLTNTPFTTQIPDSGEPTTYYRDNDGDGYGDPDVTTTGCPAPDGYVTNNLDCDDIDPTTYPGSTESENDGVDHNCDGTIDDDQNPGCGNRTGSSRALPALFPLLGLALVGLSRRRRRF